MRLGRLPSIQENSAIRSPYLYLPASQNHGDFLTSTLTVSTRGSMLTGGY
jgi:hypothetical protein